MASSTSIVHVSFAIAFLLTTTTAVAESNTTVSINATATPLRRSTTSSPATASSAHNVSRQYTCYLCQKSKSLMIRRCPIAQDDCHLSCLTLPTPAPPSPPRAAAATGADRNADDCYLMKVYADRSWVVVDVVSCKVSTPACYLVCGKGDEHGEDGGPAGRTSLVTPGGTLPHGLPEFQRCGNHFTARDAAIAG